MGILFVVLIHFIAIFILSIVIAIIAATITYFACSKEKLKRYIFFSILSPFAGLYTLYICGLLGSIIVSTVKHTDVGIGDYFTIPLANNCRLDFIDILESGSIYSNNHGQDIISRVSKINDDGDNIIGETEEQSFFLYNTKTNVLKKIVDENELSRLYPNIKPLLVEAKDYYFKKRNAVVGHWEIVIGIISLLISVSSLILLRKIIDLRFYPNVHTFKRLTYNS